MNYKQSYDDWLNSSILTKEEKETLKKMDEESIIQAFSSSLSFGTAGMRAVMGLGPNRLNIYTIRKATLGYANYLLKYHKKEINKGIVIGYDNRLNSKEFSEESANILSSKGIKVFLFDKLRPTPEISFAIRELKAIGGIIITASHNPKEYNGYKVYGEHGHQLTDYKSSLLTCEIEKIDNALTYIPQKNNSLITLLSSDFDKIYYKEIKKLSSTNIKKDNFKIVYSPQHGTGLSAIKEILTSFEYNLFLVDSQCTIDPYFSNTLSPNPEEKIAYKESIKLAKKINANLILTTDPDADRIGVAIKCKQKYTLLTGNEIAILLLDYILNKKNYPKNSLVISSIVTTSLLKKMCHKFNITFKETLTGFKYIGETITKYENELNFIFAAEESYGYLLSPITRDKDAIGAALLISEMACFYNNNNKTLKDRLNKLYKEYGYCYNKTDNVYSDTKKTTYIMNNLRRHNLTSISNLKITETQDYLKGYNNFPKSNIIKIILEDESFIAIRPSGTEPKYKIYYNIMAKTKKDALIKFQNISKELNYIICN